MKYGFVKLDVIFFYILQDVIIWFLFNLNIAHLWMFHIRYTNKKINKLHNRALRIVLDDYESTFDQLLEKDHSFSIHYQNIQRLMIEMYKAFNNISGSTFIKFLWERKMD